MYGEENDRKWEQADMRMLMHQFTWLFVSEEKLSYTSIQKRIKN
jgi:hypothetical protein